MKRNSLLLIAGILFLAAVALGFWPSAGGIPSAG